MSQYRLSTAAVADIESIAEYGIVQFGVAQALKYHLALESRFELLAEYPRIGLPTYEVRPGLYRFSYGSHVIFYTIQTDGIVVVRVLHAHADFERHFLVYVWGWLAPSGQCGTAATTCN